MADCFLIRRRLPQTKPLDNNVLYEFGKINNDLIGGFNFKGDYINQSTIVQGDDYIYIKSGSNGSCNFSICETMTSVDLSSYSSLNALVTCPTSNYSQYNRFAISENPISNNYSGYKIISNPIGQIGENAIVTIDISDINGNYYINLMADAKNEMYIYKIWLE